LIAVALLKTYIFIFVFRNKKFEKICILNLYFSQYCVRVRVRVRARARACVRVHNAQ